MTTELVRSDAVTEAASARPLSGRLRALGSRLVIWLDTCADHWAAAEMCQQLSALSDAELARRGFSRATLAHNVRSVCHDTSET
jgi:hypothetical protein